MKKYSLSILAMAAVFAAAIAHAQDTRKVTEPVIPRSGVVVKALLQADKGVFANGEADETKLDTARIQAAMDKCPKGKAVELAASGAKNAFLAGPLHLREGVILHIDKGVTLYGSRDPHVYETSPNSCGKADKEPKAGCYNLITAENVSSTGVEGEGTIDGRAGMKMLGSDKTWWEVARESRKGSARQQVPMLIVTNHSDNFTVYKITLKNSAHFHFVPRASNGITVWGMTIDTPASPNTDGFDPGGGSQNITIAYSFIRDGDDDMAIKGGPGGVNNISVLHNHFGPGHGMSIGSETNGGVSNLLVEDLSIDGTSAGIRIKSSPTRGGLVKHAVYKDVCIRNSRNPIILTAAYEWPGGQQGQLPVYQDIELHNVRVYGGGPITLIGMDATHRVGVQFDGVMLMDDPTKYTLAAFKHTDVTLGPGPTNLPITGGEDSTITGTPGKGTLDSCDSKFVPFPGDNQ